jgi:hypothetical protein
VCTFRDYPSDILLYKQTKETMNAMKIRHILLFICTLVSITGWGPFFFLSSSSNKAKDEVPGSKKWIEQETKIILSQADNLDPLVLKLGLTAYLKARKQGLDSKQLLTLVDYSKPSNERRLWVVDLKTNKVLFNTWVAHGKNSGGVNATSFSNKPTSLKSSMGVFVTNETYEGHNGYSLRMDGLEPGVNDNALSRDIVFHGANYVSQNIAKVRGMLGRSWGCLALDRHLVKPIIDTIKNKTLVVAYYPDQHWLKTSPFLKDA